ncbi:MAG: DUF5789 family protein [Halobacteriota archaeon]
MSDDEAEDEPVVELGEGHAVEGAPLARIASRLTWPAAKSEILAQEGDSEIRTPEGAIDLETLLDDVETTYFDRRQRFLEAVSAAAGTGPVLTEE